jgi:hypothetical protein
MESCTAVAPAVGFLSLIAACLLAGEQVAPVSRHEAETRQNK